MQGTRYLLSPEMGAPTASPVCPWSFWTTSFVCRFQMYTKLSSEPDTIHCTKQTNKPWKSVSVKHRDQWHRLHSLNLPSLLSPRSLQRCSISHCGVQCKSWGTCPCCSPTVSMCCPMWLPEYTCHLVRTSQMTREGCRHLLGSSDTGLKPCPIFGCGADTDTEWSTVKCSVVWKLLSSS
jgi:hypothetical protein